MVTNTIEIGTALRPLRRVTRAARTAVSPRTPRPATHRTRLPGQAPRVPALARAALAGRQTRCPLPTSSFPLSKSRRARLAYPVAAALLLGLAFQTPQPVSAQTNTTATGAPSINVRNVFRVSAVLTADLGGITDANGTTNIASSIAYQWVRVTATTETDISGATASTYTLTTADVGNKIKVKVNFMDDAGNAEGPLTSAGFLRPRRKRWGRR